MRRALAALAFALWVLPAAAQAPARPAPDEATLAAARQLGEQLNFAGQAQAMVAGLRNQVAFTFARASGKSREEATRAIDELVMPDYATAAPQLVAIITEAWASTFSAEELRELQRFYATPLGAKLQASGGGMNMLVANSSRVLLQGILTKSLQAHDEALRARGLKN